MKALIIAFTLALAGTAHAQAAQPGAGERMLQVFLDDVNTLRADFVQTLMNADREILQETHGTLAVSRPGRFRWDYDEQTIVADGQYLWLYDAGLEQVTQRALDQTLASTPAMLLSGDGEYAGDFTVEELGALGDVTWIHLDPGLQDTEFEAVHIGFSDGQLAVMELVDTFGQTTRIEFSDLEVNPDLDEALFEFIPPAGVDVIGPGVDG